MRMKNLKLIGRIIRQTHMDRILITYVTFLAVAAWIILLVEPEITRYQDALWYCYAVLSTVGFGDVLVTSLISKILSVVVTAYSALVIALVTGVIVNYCNQLIKMRQKETLTAFLDKLEHLDTLSKDELRALSESVKKYHTS